MAAEPGTTPASTAAPRRRASRKRRPLPGERAAALLDHDAALGSLVAGADEAGRGCLAGPMVAAAVLLEPAAWEGDVVRRSRRRPRMTGPLERLDDSKRVPTPHRQPLACAVIERAAAVAVVVRSAATIDRDGLHRTNLAMLGEALQRVAQPGAVLLSDGFRVDLGEGAVSERVVGGDRTSAAIAAASIIAKTVRDELMRGAAHARFPEHAFDEHVGYATPRHHEAIRTAGITVLHRRSFASVAYDQLELDAL